MRKETTTFRTFQVEGRFSVTAPGGWENSHDNDVLLLLTNPCVEGSGIFVDFTAVDWSGLDMKERLGETNESFLNDAVLPAANCVVKNITSMVIGDQDALTLRTFVAFENADVWVIQFVLWIEKQILFILHWNGPGRLVKKVVIPILDSFIIDR